MSQKIWFVKRCPLFERLTPAECQRLEGNSALRAFGRREVIYFPTEPGRSVLVLLRGRVKIKAITPDGRETIFAFIEEGELFGELALVGDDAPRREYAEAVEEAQVLALDREDLLWVMGQRPDVALHVTKLLGLRRRRIENRLQNILFRNNRDRTALLLLELLETHGRPAPGDQSHWEITLPLSHQDVANLIGATRETVTGTLNQFQREGLIELQWRRIVVRDRDRLAALATADAPPAAPAQQQPQQQQNGGRQRSTRSSGR